MNNFICKVCNKSFTVYRSLRRHANEQHPEIADSVAPSLKKNKTFLHTCEICGLKFNSDQNYKQHLKIHQTVVPNISRKCPLCDHKSSKKILLEHLRSNHEIILDIEIINFSTFEEFIDWKKCVEKDSKCNYIAERGVNRKRDGSENHYFHCHRSGNSMSKSKGVRSTKTMKIDAYCPSNLHVEVSPDGTCSVKYLKNHIGHRNDLYLTNDRRGHLAGKMADDESKLVTILSSFNKSQNLNTFHERKQKIKSQLCALIDGISNEEQLEVFNKMLTSAVLALKALENPGVACCSFPTLSSVPSSNKNIVPQASFISSKNSHSKFKTSISKPTPEEAQKIAISLPHSNNKEDI